ncbi:MAG: hypothetical protein L3J30_09765, partial [Marinosulfonomonas sp.]|nr:hypothetical protein [Marinosulfonomonas sp.]
QPTATLRHMKAPRGSRLPNLRQMAYQPKRLWLRSDDNSGAGHGALLASSHPKNGEEPFDSKANYPRNPFVYQWIFTSEQ